jgi:transcriptional regulator with XRE-family HTH domain
MRRNVHDFSVVENGLTVAQGDRPVDLDVLARNIRAARDAADLTQDEAADGADMQTAVYSRIERGEVDPRLSSLLKIAAGLGVPVSDLLRGVG